MPTITTVEEIKIVSTGRRPPGSGAKPPGGGGGGQSGGDRGGEAAVPQRAYMTGMTVALAGILMFFMALVSAYIVRKGASEDWQTIPVPPILWVNTAMLLASSFTLSRARRVFLRGDTQGFRRWWTITTVLGFLFLVGQLVAWRALVGDGVYLATNPSSSFFYVFTAAHGLHLLGGVIALAVIPLVKGRRIARKTAISVAGLYWHFMDGLWVFLFAILIMGR
jgi:cytochrome c oxidase subunit III